MHLPQLDPKEQKKTCVAKFGVCQEVFLMNVLMEESESSNKVIDLASDVRVAQWNMFRNQSSTIRGETDDNDHDVSIEAFTKQSRIQE